jgi:hypothetical protein
MGADVVNANVQVSCADICCGSVSATSPMTPERTTLIRQAFRLEWLTITWMVVEGAVAIAAGLAAGSLTLMAFGIDSPTYLGNRFHNQHSNLGLPESGGRCGPSALGSRLDENHPQKLGRDDGDRPDVGLERHPSK